MMYIPLPVLLGVDLVVKTMVEVMWAFVASGQVGVQVIMPHLVRMLQSQVSQAHACHMQITRCGHIQVTWCGHIQVTWCGHMQVTWCAHMQVT